MIRALLPAVLVAIAAASLVARGRDGSTRRSGPRTARRWELPEHLGLRLALGGTLGIAAALLTGWPMAGAWMGALGYASPVLASVGRRRAAEVARVEAIAAWAEMLRDQVAVGADLAQAIQASAGRAPAPLVEALSRLAWRMRRADPTSALAAFGEELADPMADLVVAALVVAFTRPARRVGDLLGALSESAREQAAMRLRIERDRARVRTVARASTAAAIAWVVILYAVSGRFFAPYDTPGGQVVLTLVGLAFAGGFWGLSRLDRIAPATRLQVAGARQEAAL